MHAVLILAGILTKCNGVYSGPALDDHPQLFS